MKEEAQGWIGMIQCGLDAFWRLSKSLLARATRLAKFGPRTCEGYLYLSGPDDARDDRDNISLRGHREREGGKEARG